MKAYRIIAMTSILAGLMLAKADSKDLPQEFFERADMFLKMNLIENLTIAEKLTDSDFKLAGANVDKGQQKSEDQEVTK